MGEGGFVGKQAAQREITSTNLETQWKLVIYQAATVAVAADVIVTLFWGVLFLLWSRSNAAGLLRWLRSSWQWPVSTLFLPWLPACLMLIYRFAAEVLDPSWPPPREAVSADYGTEPRWPWRRKRKRNATTSFDKTIEITGRRMRNKKEESFMVPVPAETFPQWRTFAKMLLAQRATNRRVAFSVRGARKHKIGQEEFTIVADELVKYKGATWKGKRSPRHLNEMGWDWVRDLAESSPTLPDAA